MTTRIGLISDVHATVAPLREALQIFADKGVEQVICAGDIAGYGSELQGTVELLVESGVHSILGNHDAWMLERDAGRIDAGSKRYLSSLEHRLLLTIEGHRLYVVHGSPPDDMTAGITLLDESGENLPERQRSWAERLAGFDYEVLIVGHTHQVYAQMLGGTLLVNPGSTRFNHACAILTLPQGEVEVVPLSDRPVLKAWHWGMLARS